MSLGGLFDRTSRCHLVAIPYPGHGHVNPMMNVCTLLASEGFAITFVVTEEWLSIIRSGSVPTPANIRFRTIPNVIPSEKTKGSDFIGFVEAVSTKMNAPFDQLLDQLEPPATHIISDTFLGWSVVTGNQRNIPVTSLWVSSPALFSLHYHYHLLFANGHLPVPFDKISERKDEIITYIPGIPAMRLGDLPFIYFHKTEFLKKVLEDFFWVNKAQFILVTSFYELQPHMLDTLRGTLPIPIYTIGPSIPFMSLGETIKPSETSNGDAVDYLKWLDCQPKKSVLYISLGSYFPVSPTQMNEIGMGLHSSGVRYLRVARDETLKLQETCGEMGLVVPWCDQLRVLCHSSVAGFLTHCGWNSTLEAIYAGVPMLTFPLMIDQIPNSTLIVEELKVGLRAKEEIGMENVVGKDKIACVVKRMMERDEGVKVRERAEELQRSCQRAIQKDGSTFANLHAFIEDLASINKT